MMNLTKRPPGLGESAEASVFEKIKGRTGIVSTKLSIIVFVSVVVLCACFAGKSLGIGPEDLKVVLAGMFAKLAPSHENNHSVECSSQPCKQGPSKGACVSKMFQYLGGPCGDHGNCLWEADNVSFPGPGQAVWIEVYDRLGSSGDRDPIFEGQVEVGGFFQLNDPLGFADNGHHGIAVYDKHHGIAVYDIRHWIQGVRVDSGCSTPIVEDTTAVFQLVATAVEPSLDNMEPGWEPQEE